jgi:uncharacterized paraquat-inducible protein A
MDREDMMMRAACPECDSWVKIDIDPKLGRRVYCSRCRSELIVIRLSPLELDWAFIEPISKSALSNGKKGISDR